MRGEEGRTERVDRMARDEVEALEATVIRLDNILFDNVNS